MRNRWYLASLETESTVLYQDVGISSTTAREEELLQCNALPWENEVATTVMLAD
jgi:hypothetical protein